MTGRTLSHYQILEPLGSGGMGEVFKARDTRLNRLVAIKILKPEHLGEEIRKQRFIQEAQAASALNHPNIVTIHDFDQQDGVDFMVMEYIAGRTLDARIPRQGMRINEALRIAVQIAEGLRRAHAAGIVHRDLKPSNIIVADDGLVKILDFGLAKLTETVEISEEDATRAARPETEDGTILGTAAYMSPEQAEGRKLDARTDIFSFGAMLYEMLTGRRAFPGDTRIASLSAILKDEPKPIENIPTDLEKILRRCLRKDREKRIQHMDDLRLALDEIREESESGSQPSATAVIAKPPRARWPWVVAAVCVLGAIAGGIAWKGREARPVSYALRPITSDTGLTTTPALSADGRLIAYASDRATGKNLDIWVHPLTANAQPIRVTTHEADDRDPSISADGGQIAFYSRRDGGGIYVVPALGGQERLLVRGGGSPRYSPDGQWLAYGSTNSPSSLLEDSQIFVMPATGGAPRRIGSGVGWAGNPVWSADSQSIVFTGMEAAGGIDSLSLWRAPINGAPATRLSVPQVGPRAASYADDVLGDLILVPRPGRLVAVNPSRPADSTTLFTTTGRVDGVRTAGGRIVFASVPPITHRLWSIAIDHNSGLVKGDVEPLLQASGSQSAPATSMDGKRLLYSHNEATRSELRLRDLVSGGQTVLQTGRVRGKISPDGSKVAYSDSTRDLWLIDAAGGQATKLIDSPLVSLYGWTRDGKYLTYYVGGPIRWFTLELATGKSTALLSPKVIAHGMELSPDRRWVSFHVPQNVREPIYVAPVNDGTVSDENRWIRVSATAGRNGRPWWSPDGNLLYWMSERDGYVCAWAQHLNPVTKHPKGEPFAVLHFHEARRSLAGFGLSAFGPALSRDRLTFALPEYSGNIWIAEKDAAK